MRDMYRRRSSGAGRFMLAACVAAMFCLVVPQVGCIDLRSEVQQNGEVIAKAINAAVSAAEKTRYDASGSVRIDNPKYRVRGGVGQEWYFDGYVEVVGAHIDGEVSTSGEGGKPTIPIDTETSRDAEHRRFIESIRAWRGDSDPTPTPSP